MCDERHEHGFGSMNERARHVHTHKSEHTTFFREMHAQTHIESMNCKRKANASIYEIKQQQQEEYRNKYGINRGKPQDRLMEAVKHQLQKEKQRS